jgi:hypothetical protein
MPLLILCCHFVSLSVIWLYARILVLGVSYVSFYFESYQFVFLSFFKLNFKFQIYICLCFVYL